MEKSQAFELRRIMPEQIVGHWPVVEKLLLNEEQLWNQLWTLESIEQNLGSGGFQLWCARVDDESYLFFISVILIFPTCRVLRFWWASGRGIDAYMWALVEEMNRVAQELGCTHMEMEVGRRGWESKMKPFGVAFSREILRREVTEYRRQ